MRYRTYDPWRRLREVQQEMSRAFAADPRPRAVGFPPVNIWSSGDEMVVTAEVPDVDASGLELSAFRDRLTISGERAPAPETEGVTWHRRERRTGTFSRTIELPYAIDADSVDASFRDGVLRISLRRPEEEKPRRIEVKTD